jgi:hypothetical protein
MSGNETQRQGGHMPGQAKSSVFRNLLDLLRRFLGRRRGPATDPYAYVPARLRGGPKGRSGAAVAEIEEHSFRSFPPRG